MQLKTSELATGRREPWLAAPRTRLEETLRGFGPGRPAPRAAGLFWIALKTQWGPDGSLEPGQARFGLDQLADAMGWSRSAAHRWVQGLAAQGVLRPLGTAARQRGAFETYRVGSEILHMVLRVPESAGTDRDHAGASRGPRREHASLKNQDEKTQTGTERDHAESSVSAGRDAIKEYHQHQTPTSPSGNGAEGPLSSVESELLERWNEAARKVGLPRALKLDGKRKGSLRARLREEGWADLFREACLALEQSPALGWARGEKTLGDGGTFRAHLEFMLKPGKVLSLVEQARAWNGSAQGGARRGGPLGESNEDLKTVLRAQMERQGAEVGRG